MLGRLVLWCTRTIKVSGPAANQHETSILLFNRFCLSILTDEVVRSKLRRVKRADKVHVNRLEVGFLRSGWVVGENLVLFCDSCIGNDVVYFVGG